LRTHRIGRGFTLIELLVVMLIIGVLASIAVPKYQSTKNRAYLSNIRSDLRNISSRQEEYYNSNETYTTDLTKLGFDGSNGVKITLVEGNQGGWSASATHPSVFPMVCAVYFGRAAPVAPASEDRVIDCK
jgi:type IV pilus assembly protein PilA